MTDEDYGLFVDWSSPQDSEDPKPPGVDLVIIHGLYGGGKENLDAGLHPGSGSSSWVEEYTHTLGTNSRRLSFRYNANELLVGVHTRNAIRQQARCMLERLTAERQTDGKRSIVFVAYDVGGLIVKDALYLALVRASWAEIGTYARILVFSGSPHRSFDRSDMKDRLSAFVFGSYRLGWLQKSPTLAVIPGLVEAVMEINGLFVQSKAYLRSYMLSVHAHESLPGDICHAFDSFSAALGYPFETLIGENSSGGAVSGRIRSFLTSQSDYMVPLEPAVLDRDNLFISLAPPMDPFRFLHQPGHPLLEVDAVKTWLECPRDQVLYVHGTRGVLEIAEQLFYSIQQLVGGYEKKFHVTLFFSFDGWDTRRNTLTAMLSALWAQLACHEHPHLKDYTERVMLQISEERCWTEEDLLRWFRTAQYWAPIENISLVVSGVDECSSASYRKLLEMLSKVAFGCDFISRVAVTSSKALDFKDGPSTWRCVDLDTEAIPLPCFGDSIYRDLANIHSADTVRQVIDSIAGEDPVSRHILSEQLRMNSKWLQNPMCLSSFFADVQEANYSLEFIVSHLLSSHEDQSTIQSILTWAIYGAWPLTIGEMAEAVSWGCGLQSKNIVTCRDISSLLTSVFAGILEIQYNEVRIPNRRLRSMFTAYTVHHSETKRIWHDLRESADFTIAKTCLDYLCLPEIQNEMQEHFSTRCSGSESVALPHHHERDNLCLYAVKMWPLHFSKLSHASHLLHNLLKTDLGRLWAGAFWSISNPATKPSHHTESLFPVFAGLGWAHLLEPSSPEDVDHAVVEAAGRGLSTTVMALLERPEYRGSMPNLLNAIQAAASACHEVTALQLLDRFDIGDSKWPPALMYRAAWLDMSRLVERLLQMGCPPEPGGPFQEEHRIVPLRTAAAADSLDAMLALIDHGADIDYRGIDGQGVLHYCAVTFHQRTARALVARRPDLLEAQNNDGETPILHAVWWGMYATAQCLLNLGADPAMKTSSTSTDRQDIQTPLYAASRMGLLECVRILLRHHVDPDSTREGNLATPLAIAATNRHLEVCRLLLDHGADPNHPSIDPPILSKTCNDDVHKVTPDILELLIDRGAKVNAKEEDGETALFYAVRSGQISLVQCLLDHGAEINLWARTWCPLFYSVHAGVGICKLLIERGASIETPSERGTTALLLAAMHEYADIVSLLLQHNVALDIANEKSGFTPLLEAARNGNSEITRMLMEAGADANHQSIFGYGPVHLAVKNDCLRVLLEYPKRIDLNQKISSGETPLIHAMETPTVPMENIKLLINSGADLNAQTLYGNTALSMAVWNQHLLAISALVKENGLDMNLGSTLYGPALHTACRALSLEIVDLLVQHNADVNYAVPDNPGTPLQSTCLVSNDEDCDKVMEILQYLLEHGADINRVGGIKGTVLNAAAMCCRPSVTTFLIDNGADVQQHDSKGSYPVHHAALHGIDNLVAVLEAGGLPSVSDSMGRTPLHWAAQNGRVRAVEHLLNILEPESVNTPDIDGWTPLCWAARGREESTRSSLAGEPYNQLGVIELLLRSGARLSVDAKIGEEEIWSPLQIACYSRATVDVISVLKPLTNGSGQPLLKKSGIKFGGSAFYTCDACYWDICGNRFACSACETYELCPKCYGRRDILHPTHEFTESAEEPAPPESETKPILQELGIATNDDSDSDSDSSSGQEQTATALRARRSRGRRLFRSATFDLDSSDTD
ncbi:ankyrin repeat-containing domain protein [Aspergillus stella-maris]|uniref:ankyrin repeat-containing domain protein n=1 Tax=Aspergillus stella-maris TaxID=1810926 RepID=UPI003CCD0587